MNIKSQALAAAAVLTLVAGPALADQCPLPPSPPPESQRPVSPKLPADPPCYNAQTGVSRCNNAVVRAHNAQIDTFNRDVSAYNILSTAYVSALNEYVRQVNTYAHCEIELMNAH